MATAEAAADGAEPAVSGVLLRVLADVALQHGVAPVTLFQDQAARFVACEPMDVRVSLSDYRALIIRAIALTGDTSLGLRCGRSSSEAAFDLMAPLIAHVPSLRHGICEASQFVALVADGVHMHLSERAGVAHLRLQFPRCDELTDRFLGELLTAGVMRMVRAFGGTRAHCYAARFEHRRPSYSRAYADVFHGIERFAETCTGLEFAAHLLDRPHLHFNPSLQRLVRAQAEQRIARLSRPAGLPGRLQRHLLGHPAARMPDMNAAARELGVSVRSLRRRLTEDGQSYRALTQQLQSERACTLLRNPDFTLQAVAAALGFSSEAAFHRAFKRWTGQTASEYRAGERAASAPSAR